MKKLKRNFVAIIVLFFMLILLIDQKVFASSIENLVEKVEYTDDFKRWLELSDEEKEKVMQPRMYDVLVTNTTSKNLIYNARMLGSSLDSKYSLKDIIPSNLSIKNQQNTNSCWAFAAISSLETNIAMYNYKKGINASEVYDFSERHMEYATSRTFANNVENKIGYNRNVGDGGQWWTAESYLTNGSGAINESEMPFENNENTINISEIQNKTVSSQVYDTIDFPDYQAQTDEKKVEIINQIKQHIQNYGSVFASIHGNSSSVSGFSCYNNNTGAKFCNNTISHGIDHAVSIIGWDDNYSVDKFAEGSKPKANGAWIIRNSWGERKEFKLVELKEELFNNYKQQCIEKGWNTAEEIPNEFIEQRGYIIENDIAYIKIGDNGLMYVSYEDCNISRTLYGIIKATNNVNYENIYQYDEYYPGYEVTFKSSNIMFCNVFNKKTEGTEYLTQVSLYAPETYTCKVYVNPNGTSKAKKDLQLVSLKAGETETFNAGYHTLEFSEPIEIKSDAFTVVVEVQGTRTNSLTVKLETKIDDVKAFNLVTTEIGKCFLTLTNNLEDCEWGDLGNLSVLVPSLPNADSTIKAFTTSEVLDDSLKNIEITTPPTKTSYFEGQNFDKTGMVVKANYNNKTSEILDSSSYSITNGTDLKVGQTSVTITYEDKSVEQSISVEKNSVVGLKIKTPPTKTEYKEGENFDKTGMVIEAIYKDGTTKTISDYGIEDGNNLKGDQTQISISYEDKVVQQPITVIPNTLIEIKISKAPNKTKYVVGQNFDKTGMVVTGIYQDETTHEILDYIIENGTNLTKGQSSVTINYGGKKVTQAITVEEKAITTISISKRPSKTQYIQYKEGLDLTGGLIKINYNDNSSEEIELTSEQIEVTGFDNEKLGKNTIIIAYQSQTTTFDLEIIAEATPKNSNFDKANCDVNSVTYYTFSNKNEQEYLVIDITLNGIIRNTENDGYEYYYYLSSNQDEDNIQNWVKISENQTANDKLEFKINTKDINNYSEISDSNTLYLYIREVAIKGGNQLVSISKAMEMDSEVTVEIYLDNAKVNNVNSGNSMQTGNTTGNTEVNTTVALKRLPKAGVRNILILILIVSVIGIVVYIRYKNLSKYVK